MIVIPVIMFPPTAATFLICLPANKKKQGLEYALQATIARMTTFIKVKLKKSDNIIDYHITSKLIFLRSIITKFMMIRQLFDVKNIFKISTCLKWTYGLLITINKLLCFHIVPNCIRNQHTEFENDRTILRFLN